jgi:hypothetical protein
MLSRFLTTASGRFLVSVRDWCHGHPVEEGAGLLTWTTGSNATSKVVVLAALSGFAELLA